MAQFVCLSGLPRSGSTVLSAILAQNPAIYAEGNSAVCQIMNDMYRSCYLHASEQLIANSRLHQTSHDLINAVPEIYYKNRLTAQQNIILDKCRAWTLPNNVELLKQYIDPHIKIIVLERSITDIIKSFMKIYQKNDWSEKEIVEKLNALLVPNADPIMSSANGINMTKKKIKDAANNNGANNNADIINTFIFIKYDDLLANPSETLQRIYTFCGWPFYKHQFTDIIKNPENQENDAYYNLKDFHTVRAELHKEPNQVILPPEIAEKCRQLDQLIGG